MGITKKTETLWFIACMVLVDNAKRSSLVGLDLVATLARFKLNSPQTLRVMQINFFNFLFHFNIGESLYIYFILFSIIFKKSCSRDACSLAIFWVVIRFLIYFKILWQLPRACLCVRVWHYLFHKKWRFTLFSMLLHWRSVMVIQSLLEWRCSCLPMNVVLFYNQYIYCSFNNS